MSSTERWRQWDERRKERGEPRRQPNRSEESIRKRRSLDASRYKQRIADHRCVTCAERLPRDYTNRVCASCIAQNERNRNYRLSAQREAFDATLRTVMRLALAGTSIADQAKELGVTEDKIHGWRNAARRRGYDLPMLKAGGKPGPKSEAWRKVDEQTERCVCGLLKPCEGNHPTIYEYASWRRGPGRVEP